MAPAPAAGISSDPATRGHSGSSPGQALLPQAGEGVAQRNFSCVAYTAALLAALLTVAPAAATPALTIDVATGDVLFQRDATQRWFPASTTKLMTVYVALAAVRDGKLAMDTPLVVSARAHKMPRSKMGFPIGTQVTLGNALKMLMVRSANDIAIIVAEGVAGSVDAFAADMNAAAARLGMRESHFVNPNGLPAPDHYTSARDMAVLARALYTQFPEHAGLFDIGALTFGRQVMRNHNTLLARYPGMDGMKTGYTCAAGWNLVASAVRDGRRLVAVTFGGPTQDLRNELVATLLDRGFAGIDAPAGKVAALPASAEAGPPDMRAQVCSEHGTLGARYADEIAKLDAPLFASSDATPAADKTIPPRSPMAARLAALPAPTFTPVPVYAGAEAGYTGPVAQARPPHAPLGTKIRPVYAAAYTKLKALSDEADGVLATAAGAKPARPTTSARAKKPAARQAVKPSAKPTTRKKADVDN